MKYYKFEMPRISFLISGLLFCLLISFVGPLFSDTNVRVLDSGTITFQDRRSEFIIAAPHGSYDRYTGKIVTQVCEILFWDCIVATGFSVSGVRLNVNRPTEGAGIKSSSEKQTPRAKEVYVEYKQIIANIAEGKPRLYIEIHGSNNMGIEVATSDISLEHARKLKTILEEEWHKIFDTVSAIKVQKIDRVKKVNAAVKKYGVVADLKMPAIFIELSRNLRDNHTSTLARFLATTLLRVETEIFVAQNRQPDPS
ncbi:MAG: hypothetical protein OQL16_09070 [Gammaproteobacteria bacterium]|nr:hypothetical protein [Gammaproteobacteria bacterium]